MLLCCLVFRVCVCPLGVRAQGRKTTHTREGVESEKKDGTMAEVMQSKCGHRRVRVAEWERGRMTVIMRAACAVGLGNAGDAKERGRKKNPPQGNTYRVNEARGYFSLSASPSVFRLQ